MHAQSVRVNNKNTNRLPDMAASAEPRAVLRRAVTAERDVKAKPERLAELLNAKLWSLARVARARMQLIKEVPGNKCDQTERKDPSRKLTRDILSSQNPQRSSSEIHATKTGSVQRGIVPKRGASIQPIIEQGTKSLSAKRVAGIVASSQSEEHSEQAGAQHGDHN